MKLREPEGAELPDFIPSKGKPGQERPSPRPRPEPVPALGDTAPWVPPAPNEESPQLPWEPWPPEPESNQEVASPSFLITHRDRRAKGPEPLFYLKVDVGGHKPRWREHNLQSTGPLTASHPSPWTTSASRAIFIMSSLGGGARQGGGGLFLNMLYYI